MQKPEWLKTIKNYFPEKLANTTDKLENYTLDLGRNIKYAGETLAKKATTGKGRYISTLIPGVGGWNLTKVTKNLYGWGNGERFLFSVIDAGIRGVLGAFNPFYYLFFTSYWEFTFFWEDYLFENVITPGIRWIQSKKL